MFHAFKHLTVLSLESQQQVAEQYLRSLYHNQDWKSAKIEVADSVDLVPLPYNILRNQTRARLTDDLKGLVVASKGQGAEL